MEHCLQRPVNLRKARLFSAVLGGFVLAGCVPALLPTSPMVSGRVTDGRTGQPVAGALVTVSVDKGELSKDGPAESAPRTLSDGNGQFALSEREGLGWLRLLGRPPIHEAAVRITKEGYAGFATTQPCSGSDGSPSTPVHVFAMLKPEGSPE